MAQEALPFDTHRFVQNLVASGFTEKQAEALAYEQVRLLNNNLATKSDIETLRLATKADIEALQLSTQSGMEALRMATKADIEALQLSTQSGMEALRMATESGIETLRLSTDAKIESAKFETLKWMIGAMVAQSTLIVGLTVALIKLL